MEESSDEAFSLSLIYNDNYSNNQDHSSGTEKNSSTVKSIFKIKNVQQKDELSEKNTKSASGSSSKGIKKAWNLIKRIQGNEESDKSDKEKADDQANVLSLSTTDAPTNFDFSYEAKENLGKVSKPEGTQEKSANELSSLANDTSQQKSSKFPNFKFPKFGKSMDKQSENKEYKSLPADVKQIVDKWKTDAQPDDVPSLINNKVTNWIDNNKDTNDLNKATKGNTLSSSLTGDENKKGTFNSQSSVPRANQRQDSSISGDIPDNKTGLESSKLVTVTSLVKIKQGGQSKKTPPAISDMNAASGSTVNTKPGEINAGNTDKTNSESQKTTSTVKSKLNKLMNSVKSKGKTVAAAVSSKDPSKPKKVWFASNKSPETKERPPSLPPCNAIKRSSLYSPPAMKKFSIVPLPAQNRSVSMVRASLKQRASGRPSRISTRIIEKLAQNSLRQSFHPPKFIHDPLVMEVGYCYETPHDCAAAFYVYAFSTDVDVLSPFRANNNLRGRDISDNSELDLFDRRVYACEARSGASIILHDDRVYRIKGMPYHKVDILGSSCQQVKLAFVLLNQIMPWEMNRTIRDCPAFKNVPDMDESDEKNLERLMTLQGLPRKYPPTSHDIFYQIHGSRDLKNARMHLLYTGYQRTHREKSIRDDCGFCGNYHRAPE